MDDFGQWWVFGSEQDVDGKWVFALESEACTAAIKLSEVAKIECETRIGHLELQRERAMKFFEQGGAS